MNNILERIQKLQTRIYKACEINQRDYEQIKLLPVSKHQPLAAIQKVSELGFTKFGENYIQEGIQKANADKNLQFVLIGPLQRNKAKQALINFQEIMTVDRPELVEKLKYLAEQLNLIRKIWIQVNPWSEATKVGGCSASDIKTIFQALNYDKNLPVVGFMAIPPPNNLQAFNNMANIRDVWQQKLGQHLLLSMGMSADLEQAIASGSDQVRIGSALFGDRQSN